MAYILVQSQKLNQDYRGHAEQCSYTFTVNKPDQLGALWTAKQHLEAHIAELQRQGEIILEYYLWEDKSPTFTTDYYCRIVSSASVIPWGAIIWAVLVIIGLLVTVWAIKEIKEIIEYLGEDLPEMVKWGSLATIAVAAIIGIYLVKKPARR